MRRRVVLTVAGILVMLAAIPLQVYRSTVERPGPQ